jgi:hypothetical protein
MLREPITCPAANSSGSQTSITAAFSRFIRRTASSGLMPCPAGQGLAQQQGAGNHRGGHQHPVVDQELDVAAHGAEFQGE